MQLAEASIAKIMAESRGDASEAFAQALQEKVGALLLLSQQEERHLHEENVNAALQQKVDELQRNILQVSFFYIKLFPDVEIEKNNLFNSYGQF
jgi:hypothetical protein